MADSGSFTDDDRRHLDKVISALDSIKSKGLSGILHGALPDCGDSYVVATCDRIASSYCAGEDED